MTGDTGNPDGPRDDEPRIIPPPPPPAPSPQETTVEPVVGGDVAGASVMPAEELDAAAADDAMPDDLAVSADLAMSRVDDLDIPPAEIAVPDFAIPEPPEIPPLDATAAVLLEDEKAAVSTEVPPPATRSELRARTAGQSGAPPSGAQRDSAAPPLLATPGAPSPVAAEQPAAAFAPAAPFDQVPDAPASDPSNPSGGDTYRGWPIVVFLGLAVLLVAAVIGILVLVNNPPSSAASDVSSTDVSDPVAVDAASETGCADLCVEVSATLRNRIVGPDGSAIWTMGEDWQDAAAPVSSAGGTQQAII
ncbi:hypothetical protein [Microbacterium sp. GXF0217]